MGTFKWKDGRVKEGPYKNDFEHGCFHYTNQFGDDFYEYWELGTELGRITKQQFEDKVVKVEGNKFSMIPYEDYKHEKEVVEDDRDKKKKKKKK